MLHIPQNIRQARLSKGFSQDEAAKKLGIKRTTYANWEKNIEPTLTNLMEIAKLYDCHYLQLIEGFNVNLEKFNSKGQVLADPEPTAELIYGAIMELRLSVSSIERRLDGIVPEGAGTLSDVVREAIQNKDNKPGKSK